MSCKQIIAAMKPLKSSMDYSKWWFSPMDCSKWWFSPMDCSKWWFSPMDCSQVVVFSNGNTRMANGTNETNTWVVKETAKTQASPARAQLSLLPSNIRGINACALCKTASNVQVEDAYHFSNQGRWSCSGQVYQKLLQKRSNRYATCGSLEPTCCSWKAEHMPWHTDLQQI